MTQQLAVDYSDARPAPAAIKTSGYMGVLRYLAAPGSPKAITVAEAKGLQEAGLGILVVWEQSQQQALLGAQQGEADANVACAQADALGYPNASPIFVTVGDFPATPDQIAFIKAYYNAFKAVCAARSAGPRCAGGYATAFIIDELVAAGCSGPWWQNAENDSGIPGDVVSPNAALYQRVKPTLPAIPGGGYDEDAVLQPLAWWTRTVPKPQPQPTPQPIGADDMEVTTLSFTTDGNGNGWVTSPVDDHTVVNVVAVVPDPGTVPNLPNNYPDPPRFSGVTQTGKLVFTGGAPNTAYTYEIFSLASGS